MKKEIAYLHLKEHKLFADLSKESMYELLDEVLIKRKRKNEIVDFKNDGKSYIGFIVKGKLKIQQLTESGKENTKDIIREGGFFGDLVNENKKSLEYGVTISDELVYFTVSSHRFEALTSTIPQLGLNFVRALNRKLNSVENRYSSLVHDDVRKRLVDFLKDWAEEEGVEKDGQVLLKNYLTHHDIANLISTCRQTVTSIINKLKREANLEFTRSQIVISDLEVLE